MSGCLKQQEVWRPKVVLREQAGAFVEQLSLFQEESQAYLTRQVITYLGNKRALLPFIGQALAYASRRIGKRSLRLADLFAGSGVVSRYFKQFASFVLSNDLERYAEVIGQCYLVNRSEVDWAQLVAACEALRARILEAWAPGPIAEAYAPKDEAAITACDRVFYTRYNAIYLDTARREIARLPEALQPFFLAPLLAEASIHNNTSGVFKGFYKNRQGVGCYGGEGRNALPRILGKIQVQLPYLSNFECEAQVTRADANALVEWMPEVDLAYLDPPYNQHPYGSNYFMLNLLVSGQAPEQVSRVSGIPMDWNRSAYNKRSQAEQALFELVAKCPAKMVLISYNSEGFIPYERFVDTLKTLGTLRTFETDYSTFRGCRNLANRPLRVREFLFLLEK
ncbi:MAG: DNA adenine methylase [Candidatus Spyradenecus sp.]